MPRQPIRLLGERISPLHLFAAGMLCIPGFLFQPSIWVRIAQVLVFALLATLNGKRIKWLYFITMIVSITFFNLLTPLGRVVYRLGPVVITSGALEQGITKGFTIIGLVFISLFSIRPSLRLPGRLGGMIGKVFFYYERVLDGRKRLSVTNLISSIDTILEGLFSPGEAVDDRTVAVVRTSTSGYLFAAALLAFVWVPLFVL